MSHGTAKKKKKKKFPVVRIIALGVGRAFGIKAKAEKSWAYLRGQRG